MKPFGRDEFPSGTDGWMNRMIDRDDLDGGNLSQWEMVFDERVKFLGSLVEMGIYRVSGILINDYGRVRDVKNAVKGLVLFGKTKSRRAEDGQRRSDDRDQKSVVGSRGAEVGGQKSKDGDRMSEGK